MIASSLSLLLLLAPPPVSDAPPSPSEVARAYAAAWTSNDAEAVMRLFTEDAVLLPAHARDPVRGHPAMRRFWWPPDSRPTRVVSMEMEPEETRSAGDLAWVRGRFRLAWKFEGETEDRKSSGRFVMLLSRKGTDWKIVEYMWDDVLPR
jgi:uncharacterized protein (TIGR02246 family)